jgi:hypothetical protein
MMLGRGSLPETKPRDATRGGVNFAALPRNPPKGGYGKALWIDGE